MIIKCFNHFKHMYLKMLSIINLNQTKTYLKRNWSNPVCWQQVGGNIKQVR